MLEEEESKVDGNFVKALKEEKKWAKENFERARANGSKKELTKALQYFEAVRYAIAMEMGVCPQEIGFKKDSKRAALRRP
jgi:hypothetical protein